MILKRLGALRDALLHRLGARLRGRVLRHLGRALLQFRPGLLRSRRIVQLRHGLAEPLLLLLQLVDRSGEFLGLLLGGLQRLGRRRIFRLLLELVLERLLLLAPRLHLLRRHGLLLRLLGQRLLPIGHIRHFRRLLRRRLALGDVLLEFLRRGDSAFQNGDELHDLRSALRGIREHRHVRLRVGGLDRSLQQTAHLRHKRFEHPLPGRSDHLADQPLGLDDRGKRRAEAPDRRLVGLAVDLGESGLRLAQGLLERRRHGVGRLRDLLVLLRQKLRRQRLGRAVQRDFDDGAERLLRAAQRLGQVVADRELHAHLARAAHGERREGDRVVSAPDAGAGR